MENFQYYVEGEDEKKLLSTLKTELGVIVPGKIEVFNIVQDLITQIRLMQLKKGTTVVLVFDTDAGNVDILKQNVKILNKCSAVKRVICVMQVRNLEDELVRSCNIRQIKELLGSKSNKDYKHDLIAEKNLKNKLLQHDFDILKMWSWQDQGNYSKMENEGHKIKKGKGWEGKR